MATKTVAGKTSYNLSIADGTVVRVYSGGEVISPTIQKSGVLRISNGGKATKAVISATGTVYVSGGGETLSTTIQKSGVLHVSDGGKASKTVISAGGTMYVSEGGKEFHTAVSNRGYLYIDGGRGSFTSIYSASYASVYGGGTIYEATLYDSARLNILDGGTADKTTLKKSAQLYVMVNAEASRTTAEGGKIFVNGGLANSTTLKAGGSMFVYKGQANSTTVGDGGTLLVSNGGTAFDTTANGNGLVTVSLGQADRTTINGTGSAKIYSGTMTSTTLSDSAKMYVYNLARADSVTLDNEAQMYVYGGGTARFVTMNGNGGIFVDGGQVSETIMKAGGTMNVRKSGTADSITVSKGGTLIVSGGGVVNSAIVRDQAFLEIGKSGRTEYAMVYGHVTLRAGGTMNHTTLSNGLHVSKGATVNDTTLGQLAGLHVSQGGTANGVVANNLGYVYVDGGTVNDAILKTNCSMCVYDGGTANGTVVSNGGAMRVSQGATANSVIVNGGGLVFVSAGGKLTGQVTIINDASDETGIAAEDGSVVDFDLSTVAPGSTARINNMGMIFGNPEYTITVSATTQQVGDYALTDETGNFFGTFTVKSTVGDTLGTIGIDDNEDTLQCGDYTYRLDKTEGALTLTITSSDTTDPLPPTIKASTTALTNKDVVLTATFSADTALKQYSTDAQNWHEYTSPLSVSKNGMYLFRAIDGAGNKSNIMTFTVDNIDKTAPKAPTATVSTTKPTNKSVTITASFSKDSARKLYSTDKSIWMGYTKALEATQNGTYYFQGIDAAGNVSEVTTVKVSNIDKKAPAAPKVTPDTTTLTNKNVIVTVAIPSDAAKRQFSTDNKKWSDCNEDHPVSKNGTYYYRAVDAAGNVSKVTSIKISNIDKTAPDAPKVKSSNTKATNKNITITATFSSDSDKKEYSTDKKTWKTYLKAITVGKNATYYFRGIDAAGNASKLTTLKVTNIDKTPPKAPMVNSSNSTRPTNRNVNLTATFSTDSTRPQYSTDKKTWKTYSKAITVEKNGTYYFRATDAVGNVSDVTSFKVSNIDKTAPKAPTVKASTTKKTNKNVTLTATFSTDSTRPQYSTDNKTWKAYTGAISVGKNGTYYFRAIDAAGNISKVKSIKVTNIDKTPPAMPTVTVDSSKARDLGGKSVKVTATFSADSVKKQYSVDGGDWKDYTKALTVKSNKIIEFRGIDAAGNISDIRTLPVCYYMDKNNNKWENATEVPEHILTGVNDSFDKVDYYDLEGIEDLRIVMARGKIKASFFDSDKNPIECKPDNYKSAKTFKISAGDDPDKNERYFAAIDDEVKYLKIETVASGTAGYHLYSTLA